MERGSLSLLADYGGDSSDEEVPSGKVSVKRTLKTSDEDEYLNAKRHTSRLPVPSVIVDTPNKKDEYMDDPSLHDGRKRSFPHVRGNWPTYLYIPYEVSPGVQALMERLISSLPKEELKPAEHFHITLSKTVILRHHWIELFIQSIRNNISCIKSFTAILGTLKVYCNEERTRTFIGIQIESHIESLNKIVECIDVCLGEFQLPPYYKDASFHISIAWCVGDYEEELKDLLAELHEDIDQIKNTYPADDWCLYIANIVCQTGNKYFNFKLM